MGGWNESPGEEQKKGQPAKEWNSLKEGEGRRADFYQNNSQSQPQQSHQHCLHYGIDTSSFPINSISLRGFCSEGPHKAPISLVLPWQSLADIPSNHSPGLCPGQSCLHSSSPAVVRYAGRLSCSQQSRNGMMGVTSSQAFMENGCLSSTYFSHSARQMQVRP